MLVRAALRWLLIPLGITVAGLAFVHAASETSRLRISAGVFSSLGLDANYMSDRVTREVGSRMMASGATDLTALSDLPPDLVELARDSFAVDPYETSSLRILALGSLLPNDIEKLRRTMRIAGEMSHRDLLVNLWLAQDYAQAGDLEEFLTILDFALRTSRRARTAVMDPLVNTLVSTEGQEAVGALILDQPDWESDFWPVFVRNRIALANVVPFFVNSDLEISRVPARARSVLNDHLREAGEFESLFELASLEEGIHLGKQSANSGSFFSSKEAGPLNWTIESSGNYSSSILQETGDLEVHGLPGSFGVVADRLVQFQVEPSIQLALRSPLSDNASIKLAVYCRDDGRQEAVLSLEPGQFQGSLRFAAPCKYGLLRLTFNVEPGRRDATIIVTSAGLVGDH